MSSALTCSVASLLVCSSLAVVGGCGGTNAPPPRATAAPASSPPPETTVAAAPSAAPSIPSPPATRRDDFHEVLHGVNIVDPYRWLEDQESQETRAWIDAENSYTHALLDARPERASIRARLEALSRVELDGPPGARRRALFPLAKARL